MGEVIFPSLTLSFLHRAIILPIDLSVTSSPRTATTHSKNLSIGECFVMFGESPGSLQRSICWPLLVCLFNNSAGMGILRFQSSNFSLMGLWLFRMWFLEACVPCVVVMPQIIFFGNSKSLVANEAQTYIISKSWHYEYISLFSIKEPVFCIDFPLKVLQECRFSCLKYIQKACLLCQFWTAWQPNNYEHSKYQLYLGGGLNINITPNWLAALQQICSLLTLTKAKINLNFERNYYTK